MKSGALILGITVSAMLLAAAGTLYWMAASQGGAPYRAAIDQVREVQRLSAAWSVEIARVRADPLADFDSLAAFVPRMDRLKEDLAATAQGIPELSDRLGRRRERLPRGGRCAGGAHRAVQDRLRGGAQLRALPADCGVERGAPGAGGGRRGARAAHRDADPGHEPVPGHAERRGQGPAGRGAWGGCARRAWGMRRRWPTRSRTCSRMPRCCSTRQAPTDALFEQATSDELSRAGRPARGGAGRASRGSARRWRGASSRGFWGCWGCWRCSGWCSRCSSARAARASPRWWRRTGRAWRAPGLCAHRRVSAGRASRR